MGEVSVAYVLGCDIEVIEFKFKSRYHIHFQTNTSGKGLNSFIYPTPVKDKIVPLLILYKEWVWN